MGGEGSPNLGDQRPAAGQPGSYQSLGLVGVVDLVSVGDDGVGADARRRPAEVRRSELAVGNGHVTIGPGLGELLSGLITGDHALGSHPVGPFGVLPEAAGLAARRSSSLAPSR